MENRAYTTLGLCVGLLAIIISFVALSQRNKTNTSEDTLAKIHKTNSIDACTVVNPPYTIKDAKTGQMSGYMYDAMQIIAEKINAKVTWSETTYGNGAADLQSHRCDVVVADFFANIPRASSIAFTKPSLFYVGESAVIRKNDSRFSNIKDIFEFDKPEITVAVATGESGDIFVKEHFKNAKVNRIDVEAADLNRFAVEVSAGRADVAIADANTIKLFAAEHTEIIDLFASNPFSLNPVGWAVRQDDLKWKNFIETGLQFLETQGTMRELEQKYNAHFLHEIKQYQVR